MSEFNSPFLDNQEDKNNTNEKISENSKDIHTADHQSNPSVSQQSFDEYNNEGEIEIKEEGKLLKNIIIILIILLILSILGLVLYNFIFNKKKQINKINQQVSQQEKSGVSVDENTFEMEGNNFKAGSITVE